MEADESFVQAQEQQRHIWQWSDMNASIHEVDDDLEGDDTDENSSGEEPETDSTNGDLKKECAEVSLVYKTCKHRDSLLHLEEDEDNEDEGTAQAVRRSHKEERQDQRQESNWRDCDYMLRSSSRRSRSWILVSEGYHVC